MFLIKMNDYSDKNNNNNNIYPKLEGDNWINPWSGSLSLILSASSIGTCLSGFGIVIGLPLGVIGGFCGVISISSGLYIKKLAKKISKHEKTVSFAKSKISSIQSEISKGLTDGKLSEQEFKKIQQELENYEKWN